MRQCCVILFIKNKNNTFQVYLIIYVIKLSMLFFSGGRVLVHLKYPSNQAKLYQGLDYLVYLQCGIDFVLVLKVCFFFVLGLRRNIL